MKYMGDYPSKRVRQTTDLTDAIFEPALLYVSNVSDCNVLSVVDSFPLLWKPDHVSDL